MNNTNHLFETPIKDLIGAFIQLTGTKGQTMQGQIVGVQKSFGDAKRFVGLKSTKKLVVNGDAAERSITLHIEPADSVPEGVTALVLN